MSGTRQKIQYSLALVTEGRGEAPGRGHQGTEPPVAKPAPERPACAEQLMEAVCDRGNLVRAWKRVRSNKGSPGVDGMTIEGAKAYLREHWPNIRSQLLSGTYQPQPVKRVEIPKPDGRLGQSGGRGDPARGAARRVLRAPPASAISCSTISTRNCPAGVSASAGTPMTTTSMCAADAP